ncbi:Nucleoporin nup84 [Knufia fluminis]|uniref:Nuclear pore complex protein n=1 Tax=Knufia fluminis TaxID=191047 RepID=A0AAN8EQU5_9EURO|nr:Nucleoporin nup84 [Knufia fluminis]
MPPTLRSSIHGRKAVQQPESVKNSIHLAALSIKTDFLQPEQLDNEDEDMQSDHEMMSSEMEDDLDESYYNDVDAPLQSSAQELLRPLQETADRVSRQVEEFSQALDRFRGESKNLSGQKLWAATWNLMDTYAGIANKSAGRVQASSAEHKHAQKNRKSLGDTTAQKENLLLESDIWNLTSQILPCKSPELLEDAHHAENAALVQLHRYSKNDEIWAAFMEVDPVANHYEVLLDWLQERKRKTSPALKDSDLKSYDDCGRGDVMWEGGNIYTQAPIKRQKVTRAHPGPLQPADDMRTMHFRKSDSEPLVTQMDPDAALRQDAMLEVEDELYETSAWHASWELLRRGSSPDQCRNWWQDRNELWRALILRSPGVQNSSEVNKAWLRIINLASNRELAILCRDLADNQDVATDYENAVYGILSGSYSAAAPVCESIDDHLFSLINSLLIERYEQFLSAFQQKLQTPDLQEYTPLPPTTAEISNYMQSSQVDKATKAEAHQPHKYLQSALVSDDLAHFFLEMGHAAAQMAHLTGQSKVLFDNDETQVNECAQVAAQDEDVVRMATHLQLALQPLGLLDQAYDENALVLENNIINYMGLLERHAKYSLLPLYASKISAERQPRVLGRILSKVTIPKERDMQMRLMKSYSIPVYRVIYTICDYARRTWAMKLSPQREALQAAKVIEYKDKIVRVRTGFIGQVHDEDEGRVVEAHEWVNCIDTKNWGMACWLMTALYKNLLLSGKLAAAKSLSTRVELAQTSLKVTGMNLSLAALVAETPEEDGDTDMEGDATVDDHSRLASPTKRRKESKPNHPLAKETTNRSALAEQSLVWAHLELLVQAMDTLELWQDLANSVDTLPRNDPKTVKTAKKELGHALQTVHSAMQPLLDHGFLSSAMDEQEDHDLRQIREHYLPECILAYNSALYFGGHAITRQHLVQCMELAQQVAQNETLTGAFVASRRMQELVTAFAHDSQALLRANEHSSASTRGRGSKRSSVSGEKGGRTDIWQVQWRADAET